MQIKNFEDLEIWKEARYLTREIYTLSKARQFPKDHGLRDQMQRAAVSIMSNIAEGFERGGNQEFIQYLYIGKLRAVSCVPNSTWRLTRNISIKR
jgi:23S rRNA-intervening sequence protein